MYWVYRFKVEWRKFKKENGKRVIEEGETFLDARNLKEARRLAHQMAQQEKWAEYKVDYLTARAIGRYLRTSVKKMKPVIDLIRGKDISEALDILSFIPRKASRLAEKVLSSAIANAENNHNMDVTKLFVREIYVDRGPYLKRIDTKAFGRATIKRRPTVHLTVKLSERRLVKSKPKEKVGA